MDAIPLDKALAQIADALSLDAAALATYASEDPYPRMGWDASEGDAPLGSLWSVEGKVLYALVRALKPHSIMELGGLHGASATHMAAALQANGVGRITSVDNGYQVVGHGNLIPNDLKGLVSLTIYDGVEALRARKRVDFVFEDMMHSKEQVGDVARLAKERLTPGGVLIVHDAAHFIVGRDVLAGMQAAGLDPLVVLIEPSDCGMAIWQKRG